MCRRSFNQQLCDALALLTRDDGAASQLEAQQQLEAEITGLRHQLDDLKMEMDSKDRTIRELSTIKSRVHMQLIVIYLEIWRFVFTNLHAKKRDRMV